MVVDSSSEDVEGASARSRSSSSEREKASQKSKHEADDNRRKRYRARVKNECQELKRMEKELSSKKQELLDAREGRKTAARTDIALSKSFWQKLAVEQRHQRDQVEMEQNRLVAAVQSQASYIGNLCAILREQASRSTSLETGENRLDNLKWLRLKSSDTALYKAYIEEANDSYAQIDKVFAECGMASLPFVEVRSIRHYSSSAGVESAQKVHKLLQRGL